MNAMQNSISREMRVGFFVVAGGIALLTSIILFGGNGMIFIPTYHLKIEMRDVQGLGSGSVVSLSGLHVGNVSKIEFNTKTTRLDVIMVVDRKYQTQITEGAVASLKTQGALGDRYVYIEPHPAIGSTLKDGDTLKTADSPDLFEMISSKGAQFDNILDLIKDVQRLVHAFNEHDRMTILMENMTQASQNLNGFLAEGRATLKDFHQLTADSNTKEAVVHFNSIMKKIDHGDGTLGALINDPSLHDRLLALVGENPRNKYMKSLLRQSIKTEDGQKK